MLLGFGSNPWKICLPISYYQNWLPKPSRKFSLILSLDLIIFLRLNVWTIITYSVLFLGLSFSLPIFFFVAKCMTLNVFFCVGFCFDYVLELCLCFAIAVSCSFLVIYPIYLCICFGPWTLFHDKIATDYLSCTVDRKNVKPVSLWFFLFPRYWVSKLFFSL